MTKTVIPGVLAGVVFLALIAAVLFGCAGRWDLPMFWAYLGVWSASALVGFLVADPSLIRERLRPGPGGHDYLTAVLALPLWLGSYVVAGLDVGRFHWSDTVPRSLQLAGLVAMGGGSAVVTWAVAVNRFASSVIRIQTERGHRVIAGGPYRWVRHPMYAFCAFVFIGGGLALGSWTGVLLRVALMLPILRRTALEDRFLCEHLEGYSDYARQVRHRLFPGFW
jgi:protein-S-isoprenylcysteine O-methyltransferase Ste14